MSTEEERGEAGPSGAFRSPSDARHRAGTALRRVAPGPAGGKDTRRDETRGERVMETQTFTQWLAGQAKRDTATGT